jgi:hypothetical protein
LSAGLIEHFDRPDQVVSVHLDLLAKGGYLVVSIPNLSGINRKLQAFFDRDVLQMHNTAIMEKARFMRLFPPSAVQTVFCDYIGTLNLSLFATRKGQLRKGILMLAKGLQILLNMALRTVLGPKGYELPCASPYLVFIGTKIG